MFSSFKITIFCIFINVIIINNVFCNYITSVEISKCEYFASLSSSYPESDIAKIELIKNIDNNGNSINYIGEDGSYQSKNGNSASNKFAVKLTIYNTGCNGGTGEQITIDVYGKRLNGDVDNVFVMSLENNNGITEYFSLINDWDNRLVINNELGGVFMSPPENNKLLETSKNNLIDTMFDGITSMADYRERLSNGNINDFTLLKSETVGTNSSPLTYRIVNFGAGSALENQSLISFKNKDGIHGGSRFLKQSFDISSGNDYIIGIGTDQNWVKYDNIDVTIQCNEYISAN